MAAADYDVLILGAGLAGLVAARRLSETSPPRRLLVLEAKERVGGRTYSVELPCGAGTDRWDLGGQWIGDCQPRVCGLAEQLGVRRYKQHTEGRKLLQLDGHVSDYTGDLPSIGLLGNLDLVRAVYKLESRVAAFKATSATPAPAAASNLPPVLTPAEAELDAVTMETEAARLCWTGSVRSLFGSAVRVLCGHEPSAVSALCAMRMFGSAGDFDSLTSSQPSGAQGYRMVGGAQSLCQRLAELLGPDRIRLNAPVAAIEQAQELDSASRHLVVRLASGESLTARLVVSAVPPNQLARLRFSPIGPAGLPSPLEMAFDAAVPAHYAKFIVTYETAWWRELGLSGELVSCDVASPIVVGFDGTTDAGSAALVLVSAGRPSQDLECLGPAERREAVLDHLCRFFTPAAVPSERVRGCAHFAEKFWRQEPYNGGCPSDIAACGFGRFLCGDSWPPGSAFGGRLLFAGTEFAREWIGYMEGAIESAERAAADAEAALRAEA